MSVVLEWSDDPPEKLPPITRHADNTAMRAYYNQLAKELKDHPNKWAKIEAYVNNHSRHAHARDALRKRLDFEGEVEAVCRRNQVWVRFVPYRLDLG